MAGKWNSHQTDVVDTGGSGVWEFVHHQSKADMGATSNLLAVDYRIQYSSSKEQNSTVLLL